MNRVAFNWGQLIAVDEMLDINPITLSFQDSSLEKHFRANYLRRYRLQSLLALEIALLLFGLFAILDWLLYPQLVKQLWMIRFGFALPALLVILALLLGKKYYCCGQALMASALLVANATVAAMTVVIPSEMNDVYVAGLMLVSMYGYTVSRLRFLWANLGSWSGLLIYNSANIFWGDPSNWDLIAGNFFCISTNVMGMVASYSMEYDSRQSFLLQRQLRQERSRLKQANVRLEAQVLTDELTQLANRRSFFEHFQEEWLRARRNRHCLSLVMVDVDHFKRVNDRYGHQVGDVCLQQLARSLDVHVRRAGEMAARLGGEEFVLLLPSLSAALACEVAESVRQGIESLEITTDRHDKLRLTVSCGVASVIPNAEYEQEILLSASDAAMYVAKERGRNRVECTVVKQAQQKAGSG